MQMSLLVVFHHFCTANSLNSWVRKVDIKQRVLYIFYLLSFKTALAVSIERAHAKAMKAAAVRASA